MCITINIRLSARSSTSHIRSSIFSTALHLASSLGEVDIVKVLLAVPGCNYEQRDIYGHTALYKVSFQFLADHK